jgi:TonB family protein
VVSIDRDGGVSHVGIQTSSGYSLLDESASSAIAHWHFHPATQAGEDVACDVLLPIIFQLRKFEPARMSHVSIDATPSGM